MWIIDVKQPFGTRTYHTSWYVSVGQKYECDFMCSLAISQEVTTEDVQQRWKITLTMIKALTCLSWLLIRYQWRQKNHFWVLSLGSCVPLLSQETLPLRICRFLESLQFLSSTQNRERNLPVLRFKTLAGLEEDVSVEHIISLCTLEFTSPSQEHLPLSEISCKNRWIAGLIWNFPT